MVRSLKTSGYSGKKLNLLKRYFHYDELIKNIEGFKNVKDNYLD